MKAIVSAMLLSLLFCRSSAASLPQFRTTPPPAEMPATLRVINFSLFDFSQAPVTNGSPYWIHGKVVAPLESSGLIVSRVKKFVVDPDFLLMARPEDLLQAVVAQGIIDSGPALGPVMALEPKMRRLVLDFKTITELVYICDAPSKPIDSKFYAYVLPRRSIPLPQEDSEPLIFPTFMMGRPARNSDTFTNLTAITPQGFRYVSLAPKNKASARTPHTPKP